MIYKQDNIDMSLVQCPYEEEKGYIYIADDYTNNILKLSGYDEIMMTILNSCVFIKP